MTSTFYITLNAAVFIAAWIGIFMGYHFKNTLVVGVSNWIAAWALCCLGAVLFMALLDDERDNAMKVINVLMIILGIISALGLLTQHFQRNNPRCPRCDGKMRVIWYENINRCRCLGCLICWNPTTGERYPWKSVHGDDEENP